MSAFFWKGIMAAFMIVFGVPLIKLLAHITVWLSIIAMILFFIALWWVWSTFSNWVKRLLS